MKQKFKLLASSPTLECMLKQVTKFYCGSDIRFIGTIGLMSVHNSSGKIEGVRVIKKSQRYRFEYEKQ